MVLVELIVELEYELLNSKVDSEEELLKDDSDPFPKTRVDSEDDLLLISFSGSLDSGVDSDIVLLSISFSGVSK